MPLAFSLPIRRAAFWIEAPDMNEGGPPDRLTSSASPLGPWGQDLDLASGAPDVAFVEPMTRRRLSRIARGMLHCAARVGAPEGHRMVFGSRHGDTPLALALMESGVQGEPLSPAQFSISVHNAPAGLWSLFRGNRAPCSALASGPDTFGMALLEAALASELEPERPVLCVFGEDEVPGLYHPFLASPPPRHAAAFLVDPSGPHRLELSLEEAEPAQEPLTQLSLAAMAGIARGEPATWSGPRGTWRLHAT